MIKWILLGYGVMSMVTLIIMGVDKRAAAKEQWRVPEKTLHLLELCGGWPGSLIAQHLLKHKRRKLQYQIWYWLIVVAHLAAWGGLWYLRRDTGGS